MAESYAEKEAKLISGITDVFADNEANIFEAYRVLMLMLEVTKPLVRDALAEIGGEIDDARKALDDFIGALDDESE